VTPSLLSEADWAVVAESAIWARRRAALFADAALVRRRPRRGTGLRLWILGRRATGDQPTQSARQRADLVRRCGRSAGNSPGAAGRISRLQLKEPWTNHTAGEPLLTRRGEPLCLTLAPFDRRAGVEVAVQ